MECGAAVVTQPGFIHHEGDRFIAEVSAAMHPYLYRTASLATRGVTVAFSSDAPVSEPDPMPHFTQRLPGEQSPARQSAKVKNWTSKPLFEPTRCSPPD